MTGGHGFIGSHLVKRLRAEGSIVTILGRHCSHETDLVADLGSREATLNVLQGLTFDAVFHLASSGINPETDGTVSLLHTNAEGTENLLAALEQRPACPIVVAGSWTEYGRIPGGTMHEGDACAPRSVYGISKLASTLISTAWATRQDRPLSVLRFFNVWGPGEPAHRLGPSIVHAFQQGQRPRLGDPTFRRDFVHVDDVVEALLLAAGCHSVGEIYNVGTGVSRSLEEIVGLIRTASGTGLDAEWHTSTPRTWDVEIAQASTEKFRSHFGWTPTIRFEDRVHELLVTSRETA